MVTEPIGGDYLADERMDPMWTRALYAEIASQSSGAASKSDDYFDFPPTAHPGRELFTFSLSILLIMALEVWGSWKLISWMISLI